MYIQYGTYYMVANKNKTCLTHAVEINVVPECGYIRYKIQERL